MYPIETHNRFIELRAKGCPLARIAAEFQIAKGTAVEWERQQRTLFADLHSQENWSKTDHYWFANRGGVNETGVPQGFGAVRSVFGQFSVASSRSSTSYDLISL